MTSRITAISVDALQPAVLATFWAEVLRWEVVDEDETGVSLAAPGTTWPSLDLLLVPESKAVKNRLHVDVRADGVSREVELQRLLGLGARRVDIGQGPDVTWIVLADPEGNEFCLLSRTVQDLTDS